MSLIQRLRQAWWGFNNTQWWTAKEIADIETEANRLYKLLNEPEQQTIKDK